MRRTSLNLRPRGRERPIVWLGWVGWGWGNNYKILAPAFPFYFIVRWMLDAGCWMGRFDNSKRNGPQRKKHLKAVWEVRIEVSTRKEEVNVTKEAVARRPLTNWKTALTAPKKKTPLFIFLPVECHKLTGAKSGLSHSPFFQSNHQRLFSLWGLMSRHVGFFRPNIYCAFKKIPNSRGFCLLSPHPPPSFQNDQIIRSV